MSDDNRNLLIFAIIAAVILLGWPIVAGQFLPPAPRPTAKVEQAAPPVAYGNSGFRIAVIIGAAAKQKIALAFYEATNEMNGYYCGPFVDVQ